MTKKELIQIIDNTFSDTDDIRPYVDIVHRGSNDYNLISKLCPLVDNTVMVDKGMLLMLRCIELEQDEDFDNDDWED